jgi:2-dehydro-3-deoxyglucarate aldolase/4-hydroxy-2-oxoheptanedioate aldolase
MPGQGNLKQRIRAGEQIVGVSASIKSTKSQLENILSKDKYDYLSVDSQHSPFDENDLVRFCAAAEELDMDVMFRIKHTRHTYLIGNILDLGPSGVEVPQTETEATVNEALHYFYYPQKGGRSWGGAARRGIKGRDDRLTYAEYWNNYGVLWMQVESLNAINDAKKLAKDGVDCLSWGPADLSFNREAHPEHPLKNDDDCIKFTLEVLKGTGVRLAVRNYDYKLRDKYRAMGVTVLLERPKP